MHKQQKQKMKTTDFIARSLVLMFLAFNTVIGAMAQSSSFNVTNNNSNVFTITRNNTDTVEIVKYRTVSGSAMAGIHFTAVEDTLIFKKGKDTRTITVNETDIKKVNLLYRYQKNSTRRYRLEVLDMGGFYICDCNRDINYGSTYNFNNSKVNKTITDLAYVNGNAIYSGLSDTKFVDLSYDPSTNNQHTMSNGYIVIDDEYAYNNKTLCVISTSGLFDAADATKEYHYNIGNKMYATVGFTEKEKDDGYAYIQILADNSQYDGEDPNGSVNDPSRSLYKACFELYKGSHIYTSDAKQVFPHRYDYVNQDDEIAHNVTRSYFPLSDSYLWQQKFKSDSYRADNSGALVLDPNVNNIFVRFDAAGKDNDTWYIRNLFVRLTLCDQTAPTLLSNDITVSAGDHRKGNTFTISLPFSEIVNVSEYYANRRLETTWGTLSYNSGEGTNVITNKGTINAEPGTVLRIKSTNSTYSDIIGNVCTDGVAKTFNGLTVGSNYEYTIRYNLDGGTLETTNPTSYNYDSETFTLNNPTRSGYTFLGWTGSNGNTPQTTVTISNKSHGNRSYTANWELAIPANALELLNGYYLINYAENSYEISSLDDWNALSEYIEAGNDCGGLTFKLTKDIEGITAPAGDANNKFSGAIDGDGNTMTLDITTDAEYCGLIHTADGASFTNLKVAGTINTSNKHAGGFVGHAWGGVTFTDCVSSLVIVSGITGDNLDATHGGFVGEQGDDASDALTFTRCIFNGKLLTTNNNTNCGGFVGWVNKSITVTNCLYIPAALGNGETEILAGTGDDMSATFARPFKKVSVPSSCCYTRKLGKEQGVKVYASIPNESLCYSIDFNDTRVYRSMNTVILDVEDTYILPTGGSISINPTIKFGNNVLGEEYYTISYKLNNKPVTVFNVAGVYTLTVKGNNANNYYGTKNMTFTIVDDIEPGQLLGKGTQDDPYLIRNASDWMTFSDNINNGKGATSYYKMTDDITLGSDEEPITTVVGIDSKPFRGSFDGDFHTLHLNMYREEKYAAPFGQTNGATIKNMSVDGKILSKHKFAAGFVGYSYNTSDNKPTQLINCISSVNITCDSIHTIDNSKPYDCTYGGLVGQNEKGTLCFENCIFDGRITDSRDTKLANKCTGFVGWVNNNVYYTNCTMAGIIDVKPNSNDLKNSMATFHRLANNGKAYFNKAYYINDYTYSGLVKQGKAGLKDAPSDTLSKVYTDSENTILYVPGAVIDVYNVTYYGRELSEGTDYVISIMAKSKDEHTLIISGTGVYSGSHSESVKYIQKDITTWDAGNKTGWHAISSPVAGQAFSGVTNLKTDDKHNIYRFDEKNSMWQEYRNAANIFNSFENGRGYIYRTESNSGLIEFNGKFNSGDVEYTVTYTEENFRLKGFNLIGNPYPHNIYKGVAIPSDNLVKGYCILNADGTWEYKHDYEAIEPTTAILVQATREHTLVMKDTEESPFAKAISDNIWFSVSNSEFHDVTCVEFTEGEGFRKMEHYNEDAPMLYFSQDGNSYAAATVSDDVRAIDLCFQTKAMSRYTLSVKANGNFSYLHLIDKLTGDDVDLLKNNSYSFIATTSDLRERFIVRFSNNSDDVENDTFAWQNGSDIIVNGEGNLQIFDMMGRMVMTRYINGVETYGRTSLQTGVYIIKLNEKTQKIVVR